MDKKKTGRRQLLSAIAVVPAFAALPELPPRRCWYCNKLVAPKPPRIPANFGDYCWHGRNGHPRGRKLIVGEWLSPSEVLEDDSDPGRKQ